MTRSFDLDQGDALDDLLGRQTVASTVTRPAVTPPASYQPLVLEPCKRCGGSGRFGNFGTCFACKGAGKKAFKTTSDVRAKNRAQVAARKQRTAEEMVEAFKVEHPAIWAWMDGSTFPFAVSLRDAVAKYGSLTEKQLAAAQRCVDKLAAIKAEKAAKIEAAPVVDGGGVDRLKAAFDAAAAFAASKAKGLTIRNPKIFIGEIVISPAKAGSKNEGALYVKAGRGFEAPYLGKIAGGKFFASRDCSAEQQAKVMAFIADPKAAAKAHGQETGQCCVCGAELKSEWRLRGIGPVCAEKMGWGA